MQNLMGAVGSYESYLSGFAYCIASRGIGAPERVALVALGVFGGSFLRSGWEGVAFHHKIVRASLYGALLLSAGYLAKLSWKSNCIASLYLYVYSGRDCLFM